MPPEIVNWLAALEQALGDEAKLRALFAEDSHWRDLLAASWRIQTSSGPAAIAAGLKNLRLEHPGIDPRRTPPRQAVRAGEPCTEAIFRFETAQGPGSGMVRFRAGEPDRAWTLLTALDDLDLQPEVPRGKPEVLVVGGGHAGLSIAARLAERGIGALVVDRWPRVGDNWRRRYGALRLHNQKHVNHLPRRPFPADFPVYIPKDTLADWFESYAGEMRIDYRTATEFEGGEYDAAAKRWNARVKHGGETRTLHPRHIVLATGVSGIPDIPQIDALRSFKGKVLHSSQYESGAAWRGKRAVVIGTGTSGHDIAQDLHSAGARVTLVQRSPTLVIQCDPSAQLVYSLYGEGPPLEDCDLITSSIPLPVLRKAHELAATRARELDQPLLDALEQKGFRIDHEDRLGWQFKYLTRGGGYYFNVGCSDLIVDGKIQLSQIEELPKALRDADLVVLATGYKGLEAMVEKLFGDAVAKRVGPIWGFGEQQELRNMFVRTAQPGLWFIAGSFAQCRIYSKYLALQIQASDAGLV